MILSWPFQQDSRGEDWGWVTLDEREGRSLLQSFPFTLNEGLGEAPISRYSPLDLSGAYVVYSFFVPFFLWWKKWVFLSGLGGLNPLLVAQPLKKKSYVFPKSKVTFFCVPEFDWMKLAELPWLIKWPELALILSPPSPTCVFILIISKFAQENYNRILKNL